LILQNKMVKIDKQELFNKISAESNKNGFNLYQFLSKEYLT